VQPVRTGRVENAVCAGSIEKAELGPDRVALRLHSFDEEGHDLLSVIGMNGLEGASAGEISWVVTQDAPKRGARIANDALGVEDTQEIG
jgi:hypothetical protein